MWTDYEVNVGLFSWNFTVA